MKQGKVEWEIKKFSEIERDKLTDLWIIRNSPQFWLLLSQSALFLQYGNCSFLISHLLHMYHASPVRDYNFLLHTKILKDPCQSPLQEFRCYNVYRYFM